MATPQPITQRPNVGAVERIRLALGTSVEELIAERLEDARTELMEALKLADRHHFGKAHLNIGQIVLAVDDERTRLTRERSTEHGRDL